MVIRPKFAVHAGKSQSYLITYRTVTPDSILVQHWEKLKSSNKEQQKCNSKAGRKGVFFFFGEKGDTELMG